MYLGMEPSYKILKAHLFSPFVDEEPEVIVIRFIGFLHIMHLVEVPLNNISASSFTDLGGFDCLGG